jgi:threonine dehydrogenase-like Zn-dependent dehydrogenase
MPGMESGDIMGHEFMGEVMEVGPDAKSLSVTRFIKSRFKLWLICS